MKIIATFVLFFVSTLAEPPIDNRYLPPQQGFRGAVAAPSQTYGVPGSGFSGQRQTTAIIRSRPSSTYGSPFSQRSNVQRPSTQYNTPSQLYGAPASSQMGRGNGFNGFGVQSPATQYGPPSNAPSQQYGVPGINSGFGSAQTNAFEGAQSRQYLPPGRRGYAGDDGNSGEPANYNFEYMVKDDASGNDFGHRESRQGDRAEGLYYVLLPDGRKQTVEYEADQDGYKPRISYEDTGLRTGGYAGNNQGGYSSGYPGFGSAQTNAFEGAQSRQYLPPGRRGYAGDDGNSGEPANYNFEYMVKDDASGNDFGHRESRQGDRAEGLYYVLLPDGRKQTVEYEADQDGYKPRISYEDTGLRTGGYAGNNQGGYSSGYPGQEGPY